MICKHAHRPSGVLRFSSDSKLAGGAKVIFPVELAVLIPIDDRIFTKYGIDWREEEGERQILPFCRGAQP